MQTLKNLLKTPLKPVPTSLVVVVLIVSLLGFADATYLTVEHFRKAIPPCTLVSGCETVLTSSYSVIFGIPVALGGAIFYLLVAIGAAAYLEGKHEKMLRYTLVITVLGLLASIWFVVVQAFILHSWCLYCLGSALTSTILFIMAWVIFYRDRQNETIQ